MRKILSLLILLVLALPLCAKQYESINVEAFVPDDYSIVIPEAVSIDRLVFEIELESGEDELMVEPEFSLGELSVGSGSTSFSLLYYGNLSSPYDVVINATSDGLINEGNGARIPIEIEIIRDDDCLSEIETTSLTADEMHLVVPPMGAIEGEPVVKFIVTWDSPEDLPLGHYEGTMDLELRSF